MRCGILGTVFVLASCMDLATNTAEQTETCLTCENEGGGEPQVETNPPEPVYADNGSFCVSGVRNGWSFTTCCNGNGTVRTCCMISSNNSYSNVHCGELATGFYTPGGL